MERSKRSGPTLWAIAILGVFVVASTTEIAAEPKRAEVLINEGIELRRAGQDAQALPKFEEAYRLAPTPRASAQWGLCLQAVGRWSEADGLISEALKSKSDPWVAKNRATLKDSLEQVKQNVARVEVYGGPDGANVTVNGRNVGTYPLSAPAVVNAGNLDIEVTKAGFKRGYRSMTIAGGHYERVLIRLEETEVASKPMANLLPVNDGTGTKAQDSGVAAHTGQTSSDDPAIYQRPWFWVAVGAVVVAGLLRLRFLRAAVTRLVQLSMIKGHSSNENTKPASARDDHRNLFLYKGQGSSAL